MSEMNTVCDFRIFPSQENRVIKEISPAVRLGLGGYFPANQSMVTFNASASRFAVSRVGSRSPCKSKWIDCLDRPEDSARAVADSLLAFAAFLRF